jgi:precorrin-4/cobalt-precorrin-4 C11-methyltransferase
MTPGVPAFAASAAALGRELTVPEVAQTVILTRYSAQASRLPAGEALDGLAAHGATLVIHLGAQAIDQITASLSRHYGADCPAAVVAFASRPEEQILRGTLSTIAGLTTRAGIRRSATIIVGPALAAEGFRDSHLYSVTRPRQTTTGHGD